MAELKPCPFCGGDVELLNYTERTCGFWDYKIRCKKCRAYMDSPPTGVVRFTATGVHPTRNAETMRKAKHELITAWNRRADDAKVH